MKRLFGLTAILIGLASSHQVLAQLTATVEPGYVFSPSERPSSATLNLLGHPTIKIAGTISGSVGLAAGTVHGEHLAGDVVDGITIQFNPSMQLEVRPGGITPERIAFGGVNGTNIGSATIISTNIAEGGIHGTNIGNGEITTDNLAFGAVNGTNIGSATIISTNIAENGINPTNLNSAQIGEGLVIEDNVLKAVGLIHVSSSTAAIPSFSTTTPALTVTHGLGMVPRYVRVVLVAQSNNQGFVTGDEIDAAGCYEYNDNDGVFTRGPQFSAYASATTVNVRYHNTGGDPWVNWQGLLLDPSAWRIKVYYAR